MLEIRQAQDDMDRLKYKVIGFLQDRNAPNNIDMILSISKDKESVDTVNITKFGAIQHQHNMPVRNNHIIMIPKEYGNFAELLRNPFKWQEFHNDNFKH